MGGDNNEIVFYQMFIVIADNQGLWRDRLNIPVKKRTLFTFRRFLHVTSPVGTVSLQSNCYEQ